MKKFTTFLGILSGIIAIVLGIYIFFKIFIPVTELLPRYIDIGKYHYTATMSGKSIEEAIYRTYQILSLSFSALFVLFGTFDIFYIAHKSNSKV